MSLNIIIIIIYIAGINSYAHELPRWGQPFLHNVTNSHVEVEQAPFAPAIARCYQAILSIEHDLS